MIILKRFVYTICVILWILASLVEAFVIIFLSPIFYYFQWLLVGHFNSYVPITEHDFYSDQILCYSKKILFNAEKDTSE